VKPGRRGAKPPATPRRSGGKAVIALAVMGGLVILYGWNSIFLAPKAEAKAAAHKELVAARQQEQELRRNLTELRKLANDSQAREAELARIGRLIPAAPDVAGAIDILNGTAQAAQVAWSSFVPSPSSPAAAGGPSSISIGMKISGTFGQIFDYLRRLELLDRLVVVDALQLTAEAVEGTGPPTLQADVKARMFSAGTASLSKAGG
jgi:Tfp pilus assembly protein PilO